MIDLILLHILFFNKLTVYTTFTFILKNPSCPVGIPFKECYIPCSISSRYDPALPYVHTGSQILNTA